MVNNQDAKSDPLSTKRELLKFERWNDTEYARAWLVTVTGLLKTLRVYSSHCALDPV
jgi:hypothetical protein